VTPRHSVPQSPLTQAGSPIIRGPAARIAGVRRWTRRTGSRQQRSHGTTIMPQATNFLHAVRHVARKVVSGSKFVETAQNRHHALCFALSVFDWSHEELEITPAPPTSRGIPALGGQQSCSHAGVLSTRSPMLLHQEWRSGISGVSFASSAILTAVLRLVKTCLSSFDSGPHRARRTLSA